MHLTAADALVVELWVVMLVAWLRFGFLVAEGCMWVHMLRRKEAKALLRRGSVWAVGSMVGVWIEEEETGGFVSLGSTN